jgi:hypothetical protein
VRKMLVGLLSLAVLLGACGGAGSGGSTAPKTATAVPVVAGTEAPKEYNPGKTADPNASPEDYYGY